MHPPLKVPDVYEKTLESSAFFDPDAALDCSAIFGVSQSPVKKYCFTGLGFPVHSRRKHGQYFKAKT